MTPNARIIVARIAGLVGRDRHPTAAIVPVPWRIMPGCQARHGRLAKAMRVTAAATTLGLVFGVVPAFGPPAGASPIPISPGSAAPVVSYGTGLATVVLDQSNDILLFTEAKGASTWKKKVVERGSSDELWYDPNIASDGNGNLVISAAVNAENDEFLWSWTGRVGGTFTSEEVAYNADSRFNYPSIAFSPRGGNFVIADTDETGAIDFWYQGGTGWVEKSLPRNLGSIDGVNVDWTSAVVTVTDNSVVIVAIGSDTYGTDDVLETFYQPLFTSGWTLGSLQGARGVDQWSGLSAVWTGSDLLAAYDQQGDAAEAVDVIGLTDEGVYNNNAAYSLGAAQPKNTLHGTAIAWSGFNAVVVSEGNGKLNFFYSDSNFKFHEEPVTADNSNRSMETHPGIAVANSVVEITDNASNGDLYGYSQATGGKGFPQKIIAS